MKIFHSILRSALVLSLLLFLVSCQSNKDEEKFNVLFIAIDDLRTELNCYGANHIKSPNIDRLAVNGVRFTQAHVQQAICMASRASIMSGLRPETKGIYTGEPLIDLLPDVLTLNQLFEENDYNVSAFGKIYHYGADHLNQFGDRHIDPTDKWHGKGYLTDESAEHMRINGLAKGGNSDIKGLPYEYADVADSAYQDGYITEFALRKLDELKKNKDPFFMAIGFHKPHLPFTAPKKYWDLYPVNEIAFPTITDVPEKSNKYTLRPFGELRSYYGMPQYSNPVSVDTTLILRQGYFACVSYVDALLGKLLDKLDELELTDNTIIVLWGDHGYKLGDYGYWCKWSNMNIDTNVPLIINVPGGKTGGRCNVPVETLDIYPTLANLCGIKIPSHVEGKSLVPLLKNPTLEKENYVYTCWPHDRTQFDKTVMGYSIKTSRYNYQEWVKLSTGEILERELYDRKKDPNETKNMIADNSYAEVIKELAQKCLERKITIEKK